MVRSLLFNARSVCNKIPDLHTLLFAETYEFIFITETWMNIDIPDSMLILNSDYNIFRCDRLNKKGGGVLTFFRKNLPIFNVNVPYYVYLS